MTMKHPEAKEPTMPAPPKRRRRKADKRGVALVMTLGAITVLTVFLTELQEDTSAELSSALTERDALRAEYYARSAVNLSRLLIAAEPDIRKSIPLLGSTIAQIPVWEFTDMVLGPFNDQTGAQAFTALINADAASAKNVGLTGGGHFDLKIIDEDSKLNINTAARSIGLTDLTAKQFIGIVAPPSYNPLFESRDGDGQFSDRQAICGALIDWVDEDENLYACDVVSTTNTGSKGAEDNFYQTLGLGYRRKNAPFDTLEEMRLVRGVGDDFWPTFVDPEPSDPHKRIMTVWGAGKVNINTANAQVLIGVICSDSGAADFCGATDGGVQMLAFIQGVTLVRSFTMGAPLFAKPGDLVTALQGKGGMLGPILASLGIKPITFKAAREVTKLVSTQSHVFSIYADGVVPGYRKSTKVRIHSVVSFQGAQPIGAPNPVIANTHSGPMPVDAYKAQVDAYPGGHVLYWRVE
jgi:general secretion pathway protein K